MPSKYWASIEMIASENVLAYFGLVLIEQIQPNSGKHFQPCLELIDQVRR
jgi:hypothetical protein